MRKDAVRRERSGVNRNVLDEPREVITRTGGAVATDLDRARAVADLAHGGRARRQNAVDEDLTNRSVFDSDDLMPRVPCRNGSRQIGVATASAVDRAASSPDYVPVVLEEELPV